MGRLKPDYYYDTVFDIPYEELLKNNIHSLIFDIDNTLAPYEEHQPSAKTTALVNRLKKMGFKLCLLTNNTNRRLDCFTKPLDIPGIANAAKPFKRGIKQSMKQMGTKPENTAIIGDQLLSDIWGGKNTGITTILIKPLSDKDFIYVRLKRKIENRLLRRYYGDETP